MVCSTAFLSSSLALSLLRHSILPSQSFVLSPFSLNSALAIIHDGANGNTHNELTEFLLNGCTSSDVTDFYSSLTLSLPTSNATKHFKWPKFTSFPSIWGSSNENDEPGVSFKSANRFYVDDSITLKRDYQKEVEEKYKVRVLNINLQAKNGAAEEMNNFVNEATNGKINKIVKAEEIPDGAKSYLINALYIYGRWAKPFETRSTSIKTFKGHNGDRKIDFMYQIGHFPVNQNSDIGTVLILPYKDDKFKFFFLMPNETSSLGEMREELNGQKLIKTINDVSNMRARISVPKIKVESAMDGKEVLSKMGVNSIFSDDADFSKISSSPLHVSKITQKVVLETNEEGTEAAAVTFVEMWATSQRGAKPPPLIVIDRPFLFGILRGDDILFIGQFV